MPALRLLAPAKVNLTLEVLGRRPDGYHEVRTVMQAVDLCDELVLAPSTELSLSVAPADAAPVEANLVLRAAEALAAHAGVTDGAAITLRKHIPTAAGLGGGSSDAGATLLGLRRLWDLAVEDGELADIAASLGSDVPFFLCGGTALATGRGETLLPLPSPQEGAVVLLAPGAPEPEDKTRRLYGMLRPEHYAGGEATDEVVGRLHAGEPVADMLVNTFEAVAADAYAAHRGYREALPRSVLAGAGPSVFALFAHEAEARLAADRLARQGYSAYAAGMLPAWGPEGLEVDA